MKQKFAGRRDALQFRDMSRAVTRRVMSLPQGARFPKLHSVRGEGTMRKISCALPAGPGVTRQLRSRYERKSATGAERSTED